MAKVTASVKYRLPLEGTRYLYVGTLANDASYAAGGQTLENEANPRIALPATLDKFDVEPKGGYSWEWLPATGKLKAYDGSGANKEAGAVNITTLAGSAIPFTAIGP